MAGGTDMYQQQDLTKTVRAANDNQATALVLELVLQNLTISINSVLSSIKQTNQQGRRLIPKNVEERLSGYIEEMNEIDINSVNSVDKYKTISKRVKKDLLRVQGLFFGDQSTTMIN